VSVEQQLGGLSSKVGDVQPNNFHLFLPYSVTGKGVELCSFPQRWYCLNARQSRHRSSLVCERCKRAPRSTPRVETSHSLAVKADIGCDEGVDAAHAPIQRLVYCRLGHTRHSGVVTREAVVGAFLPLGPIADRRSELICSLRSDMLSSTLTLSKDLRDTSRQGNPFHAKLPSSRISSGYYRNYTPQGLNAPSLCGQAHTASRKRCLRLLPDLLLFFYGCGEAPLHPATANKKLTTCMDKNRLWTPF
jgi:hypothetical protein